MASLKKMARQQNNEVMRAGSTNDPERRRREYVYKDNYSGVMYCAPSKNMRDDEDSLLNGNFSKNVQKTSNQTTESGFGYLIVK